MRYTFKPKRQFKFKLTNRLRISLTIFLSCLFVISGYLIAMNSFSLFQHEYFNETTEDGVNVRVVGDLGVIPDGTHLAITKVSNEDKNNISNSINQVKEAKNNVVESYSYDIKILNENNEEIEPSSDIKLIFSYDKIRNNNLDTNLYHTKNIDNELKTEVLPGTIIDNTITTETDSFSYYTVEFTYDNLTYSIEGDSTVKLSEVLEKIGLSGNVSGVTGSNDSLFSFENRGGEWYVISHQAFQTAEWMKVAIDGVDYDIVVTDANSVMFAEFDSSNGKLRIFAATSGSYTDGQVVGTKTYWTEIESLTGNTPPKWNGVRPDVRSIVIEDSFVPLTAYYLFYGMNNLTSITGISNLDTSNVTNMNNMFKGCSSLTSLNLSSFNTSNVELMSDMFWDCTSLTTINLSNFDTSNVTNMGHMFTNCSSLIALDVSHFNTSNVTYMDYMFSGCSSLTNLNISNFNTYNVTRMGYMFNGCSNLTSLDLTVLDTRHIVYDTSTSYDIGLKNMFSGCTKLRSITFGENFRFKGDGQVPTEYQALLPTPTTPSGKWIKSDRSMVKTPVEIRNNFDSNVSIWKGTWKWDDAAYVVLDSSGNFTFFRSESTYTNNTTGTFTDISGNTYTGRIFVGFEDSTNTSTDRKWFSYINDILNIRVAANQTISPINCQYWFQDCSNLISCDLTGFDFSSTSSMGGMFKGCSSLTSLNLSSFNTSNVELMSDMFWNCTSLTTINLSNFDTSNVTNMGHMFTNCSSLIALDVSHFNTSNVTYMDSMFSGCTSLTSLNVSNFDTSNVTRMGEMFKNCSSLTSLDLSSFDSTHVAYSTETAFDIGLKDMFSGCDSLYSISLGENFRFKGDGQVPTEYQALLPTPNTTSGRWIKTDASIPSKTPVELRNNYDSNVSTWKGTWVWECKIIITEEVRGSIANVNKNFPFTLNVTSGGTGLNGNFAYTGTRSGTLTFTNGSATFNLKHGENLEISLPGAGNYTITQNNDGYTLTKTNDSGILNGDVNSTFTDTLNGVTPTGIFIDLIPYIILLIVSVFGIVWITKFKKI